MQRLRVNFMCASDGCDATRSTVASHNAAADSLGPFAHDAHEHLRLQTTKASRFCAHPRPHRAHFLASHSSHHVYPRAPHAASHLRVVGAPQHMKRLLQVTKVLLLRNDELEHADGGAHFAVPVPEQNVTKKH